MVKIFSGGPYEFFWGDSGAWAPDTARLFFLSTTPTPTPPRRLTSIVRHHHKKRSIYSQIHGGLSCFVVAN